VVQVEETGCSHHCHIRSRQSAGAVVARTLSAGVAVVDQSPFVAAAAVAVGQILIAGAAAAEAVGQNQLAVVAADRIAGAAAVQSQVVAVADQSPSVAVARQVVK